MEITQTIQRTRQVICAAKKDGKSIGFVPTMGALHKGHFSLIKAAGKQCDFVAVSIFVNPAQFAAGEDIDKYPRTFDADRDSCKELGVDLIFAPSASEMYPNENLTWVSVEKLTANLCGRSRPGHFRAVATVCARLFNIVTPDFAFFGQKDAQQAIVIQRMATDLNMPLEIVVCPTVREPDGLAASSRNKYLSDAQRKQAAVIYAALQEAQLLIAAGVTGTEAIIAEMQKTLNISPDIDIDYVNIVDAASLEPVEQVRGKVLIAMAVKLGEARLIDNIIISN